MEPAIEVEGLTKAYGELTAVDGIDFTVDRGEIFGFLGPNGAGKTTTVRMLTGIFPPDSGKIFLAGYDLNRNPLAAKRKIGVAPEMANAYLELTALENVLFMANLYGLSGIEVKDRAKKLLTTFGLKDRMGDKVKQFSKGLQQRVIICMALVNDPEIIFLDEPTSGLDVKSRQLIREVILELNEQGKTIFLTTHDIEEANKLCSKVAIINQGQIAAIDRPERLKGTIQGSQSLQVSFTKEMAVDFNTWSLISKVETEGDKYRLYTDQPGELIFELTEWAQKEELQIQTLNTLGPSLEDVFVQLTGGNNHG
jgi:ABC-2 type transport system ATP-binding protein